MAFLKRGGALGGIISLGAALLVFLSGVIAHAASNAQDGATGEEPPRLAFVIGMNEYLHAPLTDLRNPINDGKLIAGSLRRLNFTVVEGYDMGLADVQAMFNDNKPLIDKAEAVVFYFAGHGFQLQGTNFLVPVDAKLTGAADIAQQTVKLDDVIKTLEDENRPLLIFLDACRENPLPGQDDAQDGLAQIEAGLNTFIAFSTEPGNVANGGAGNNSPFALALAKHLETPGLSISDLTIAVRNETRELTLDRQSPWSQESLRAQFYFTERQQLDQQALLLAAARIMEDPARRTAFIEAQDQGLSFQAALFRAQQRGANTLTGETATDTTETLYLTNAPDAAPAESIEIASADPATTVTADASPDEDAEEALEQLLFARLTDGNEQQQVSERERREELARQLQTELQRLGCYRMAIDGIWGPGSRRALRDFARATKQSPGDLAPSRTWLSRAAVQSGRLCRAPVIIKRQPAARVARTTPRRSAPRRSTRKAAPRRNRQVRNYRRRAPKGQSRKAQRQRREQRRSALPPDISAGVGIGF